MTQTKNQHEIKGYRASLKSSDTEEWFDLMFYRRIGYVWALLAAKLGITPNAITIASIFLGIGAAVMFYFNSLWLNLIGVGLLVWANSFDSADGQLARMTGQYSRIGRILDGVSGDIWFIAIYAAICLRENMTGGDFFEEHKVWIWVLAAVAGVCHAKQASMADYYRQLHLYFVNGKQGSELETSSHLREKLRNLSWRKDFFEKLVLTFYVGYTTSQEAGTTEMQRLRAAVNARFHGTLPERLRSDFRAASLPLMKYTNILSFNVRSWALVASLIVKMPWLYFVFELTVMNVILIYMRWRHERICRAFTKAIEDGEY